MLHQTPQEIRNRANNILIISLLIFSVFSFCYSLINVLADPISNNNNPTVDGQPSENFFITILENPFTSTILSTIFIAGAAYVFNKLRTIKKRLDSIASMEADIQSIKSNQDELKKSMTQVNITLNKNTEKLNERLDSIVDSNNRMKNDIYEKLLSMAWSASSKNGNIDKPD